MQSLILFVASSESRLISLGERARTLIAKFGFADDARVVTALIGMYGKCGEPQRARDVFEAASRRSIEVYTSLISAYAHAGDGEAAAHVLNLIEADGHVVADSVTVLAVLNAAAGSCVAVVLNMLMCGVCFQSRHFWRLDREQRKWSCGWD